MAHLWHAADVVPVDKHIPLDVRSSEELEKMRDDKASLFVHLEQELFYLQQPSELEKRVAMLEGAVALAEDGDRIDPRERDEFLRRFVEDLRDDHHRHMALYDHGTAAEMLPHGLVLKVDEHPILTEHRAQAAHEEYLRKHPSEEERHPDIGRPGYFAENYRLKPNPWNEQGFDYTKEVSGGKTPWHDAQEMLDNLEEFDNKVAESSVGQFVAGLGQTVSDNVPQFITEVFGPAEVEKPVQYGCGDVFVDRDRAKSTGRAMRWQMAEAGLPVYGDAPPVTMEWLEENNVLKAKEEEEEPERQALPARPPTAALNYGAFDPQTFANMSMMNMSMMRGPPMPTGPPPIDFDR
jgi:hypothetical protein